MQAPVGPRLCRGAKRQIGMVLAPLTAAIGHLRERFRPLKPRGKEIPVRFLVRRILGVAPVFVLALLVSPATGVAQPRPDLTVTSLTEVPSTAYPGDGFAVTANVLNQGPGVAGATATKFELVSTVPGGGTQNLKGIQMIPGLAPDTSAAPRVTLSIYSDTPAGKYLVRACANKVPPKILETTTLNNCFEAGPITVFEVPDVEMQTIEPPAMSKVPQGQG